MANSLYFTPVCSFTSPNKPGVVIGNSVAGKVLRANQVFPSSKASRFQSLAVKATDSDQSTKCDSDPSTKSDQSTKTKSLVCTDCDGNGAIVCSQCKGSGVNSVDHFNGQFKAGAVCWLCRGRREILCGGCNGAGFVGGFMSTLDA